MSRWLYQMSESSWSSDNYRRDVKEGRCVRWPTRKMMFAGAAPAPGDLLICFYAPTACKAPGFCGLGLITKYLPLSKRFDWVPVPPTNVLRHAPWWDERARDIADLIRAQSPRATMYPLPAAIDTDLRRGLFQWARSPGRATA
jgi:hypothetical protein